MAKKHILLRTNILVCLIIAAGFLVTAFLSYQANYGAAAENIEQVSSLTSEGIYYQLTAIFTKPVNVSLTMANDSLLRNYLEEEERNEDPAYTRTLQEYLSAYQKKYGYESVFLVSAATERYYNFNGIDRTLSPENPENGWYYSLLDTEEDYCLNVDNDEAANSNNEIMIFVNCKIRKADGSVAGIVGVGLRVEDLQRLLTEYEEEFGIHSYLVGESGRIEVSCEYTGLKTVDFYELSGLEKDKGNILSSKEAEEIEFWTEAPDGGNENYVVARYVPELSWYLIVERDTGHLMERLRQEFFLTVVVIAGIIVLILFIITSVIRGFNHSIRKLIGEHEVTLRKATEQFYGNIYEWNITENRAAGPVTRQYLDSLGIPEEMPYGEALEMIAEKQIEEEFREGYVNTFRPDQVLKEYAAGVNTLNYDFIVREPSAGRVWIRSDAHIYYNAEDDTIRMFTCRKNINQEKQEELAELEKEAPDGATGLDTRTAVKRRVEQMLAVCAEKRYVLFVFGIDSFEQAEKRYGSSFAEYLLAEFADMIRRQFRAEDIKGRLAEGKIAVFLPAPDSEWITGKAKALAGVLKQACTKGAVSWEITVHIGAASAPEGGSDFETLYKNACTALVHSEENGMKGYEIYKAEF